MDSELNNQQEGGVTLTSSGESGVKTENATVPFTVPVVSHPVRAFSQYKKPILFSLLGILLVCVFYFSAAFYLSWWPIGKKMIAGKPAPATEEAITVSEAKASLLRDYGFKLTLPEGWKKETVMEAPEKTVFQYSSPDSQKVFWLSIVENIDPEITTMAVFSKEDALLYDSHTSHSNEFSVAGLIGDIYTGKKDGKIYKRMYLIRGNLHEIYRFTVEMSEAQSWMENFDNIVKSFKFVEPRTENFKVYKNIQFSYTLSYPDTWRVKEGSDEIYLSNYYNRILDGPENPVEVHLEYMKNTNLNQDSLTDWLKQGFFVSDSELQEKVDLGDEAIRTIPNGADKESKPQYIKYLVRKGKDILLIGYSRSPGQVFAVDPDKIIQTLKFVPFDSTAYTQLVERENQKIIGEDKDEDGVWDYIETYINQKFSFSAKLRAGLFQFIKVRQMALLDRRDREKSILHANESDRAMSCLSYITESQRGGKRMKYEDALVDVEAEFLNTRERYEADVLYNGQLGGVYQSPPDGKQNCDFDPDTMKN